MGHGCYYTTGPEKTRAYWVEPENEDMEYWEYEDLVSSVLSHLPKSFTAWKEGRGMKAENKLYTAHIECGHGNELVLRLELRNEGAWPLDPCENLAKAGYFRTYESWKNALLRAGYELRVATSGYTSASVTLEGGAK